MKTRYFKALVEYREVGRCIFVLEDKHLRYADPKNGTLFAERIGMHIGSGFLAEISQLECARLALEGVPVYKCDRRYRNNFKKLG